MNYEPNTERWKVGDVVIHDADAKRHDMLMIVVGVSNDGWYKTVYMSKLKPRKTYHNELKYLHDPKRFGLGMRQESPDTCPICEGRGYVLRDAMTQDNLRFSNYPFECWRCDGTGKYSESTTLQVAETLASAGRNLGQSHKQAPYEDECAKAQWFDEALAIVNAQLDKEMGWMMKGLGKGSDTKWYIFTTNDRSIPVLGLKQTDFGYVFREVVRLLMLSWME